MKWNHATRFYVGLRKWAMRLGMMALLILLSGTSREADALQLFHVDAADDALSAAELPLSPFLPAVSMNLPGPLVAGAVELQSRAPITPVSPSPPSGLLFMTALLGMLGVAVQREPLVRRASSRQISHPKRSSLLGPVIVLSQDEAFADEIEGCLHGAGYDARVVGSTDEIVSVSDPAALALVLVDQRIQDWDMLRTDPRFRHVQLMAVVPPDNTYTEGHCLADLERGLDGAHDLGDGYGLLVARVGAYLRRASGSGLHRGIYQVGAVQFDGDSYKVTVAGQPVHLSAKPLAILEALMREPTRMFTRKELTHLLWGQNFAIGGHALDVHVHTLRQQLNRHPDRLCRLITIKGVGFKLKPVAPAYPTTQGTFDGDEDRASIRSHTRLGLRCLRRQWQRNKALDPKRRMKGIGGKAAPIRRHVTASATEH
ncbi:MAG: winged-helix domain-containing protein [Nitrospira sp.]